MDTSIEVGGARLRLRVVGTADLTATEVRAIRAILWAAFADDEEGFTEDDWEHATGGTHFVLDLDDEIVSHASVVERTIFVDERPLRTGYVEGVATAPGRERAGFGSRVMAEATWYVRRGFELGVLGTGRHRFYERLGWRRWTGPSSVRTVDGIRRTPEDDGFIMVLQTPTTPRIEFDAPIACEWRPGDVW